jgi:hypothetical protein
MWGAERMSEDKSQPHSLARPRWWAFPLVGLIIIVLGVNVGVTGKLYSRLSKAEMDLARATAWVYGGCLIAIGAAIALSPLYYRVRRRA